MNMEHSPNPFYDLLRTWGAWAVALGALSLGMVFLHITWPMMQPQPSAGTQIGEIAGDMARAAWLSFFGMETTPETEPASFAVYIGLVGPVLGVIAIVLALISSFRHEDYHFALYGSGLGIAAVVFHFFWWVTLVIAGVMLLIAIMENLGGIFTFGFWD